MNNNEAINILTVKVKAGEHTLQQQLKKTKHPTYIDTLREDIAAYKLAIESLKFTSGLFKNRSDELSIVEKTQNEIKEEGEIENEERIHMALR